MEGMDAEALKGPAGTPMVASWWKAKSSGLVMMEIGAVQSAQLQEGLVNDMQERGELTSVPLHKTDECFSLLGKHE